MKYMLLMSTAACEGVPTEWLTPGCVEKLMATARHTADAIDSGTRSTGWWRWLRSELTDALAHPARPSGRLPP